MILWPLGCFLVWSETPDVSIVSGLWIGWMMGMLILIFIIGPVVLGLLWVLKFISEIVKSVRDS